MTPIETIQEIETLVLPELKRMDGNLSAVEEGFKALITLHRKEIANLMTLAETKICGSCKDWINDDKTKPSLGRCPHIKKMGQMMRTFDYEQCMRKTVEAHNGNQ